MALQNQAKIESLETDDRLAPGSAADQAADAWLDDELESGGKNHGWFRRRWAIAAVAVALVIAGIAGWRSAAEPAPASYGVVEVRPGDLVKTITATGRVQALTTVDVGTQVSGTIAELYADFNSRVQKGQIIARLDPSQLEAQLTQAKANFQSAQARVDVARSAVVNADAGVQVASANVDRTEAARLDAQRNYELTQQLVNEGITARQQLDTAQASLAQAVAQKQQAIAQLDQAKAQARSARSQLSQAQADAQQAQAAMQVASLNLERTVIRAPIDGVVVARNVDVGQTVAASLQAPTLFLIANDLTRMQVLADIDEADVGQLGPDSKVTFTVDAFPADTFHGQISQIRLGPQTVQNVVTYTAVIDVANPELKLKPGMTANITAIVAERHNVLAVPNAALRFRPENAAATAIPAGRGPVVWKVDGDKVEPVRVRLGITDGISSEVVSGNLAEGDQIAVPAQSNTKTQTAPSRSMFPMGGRGGRH